ncbi:hypothetical protein [Streptomyces sp. NPDC055099]
MSNKTLKTQQDHSGGTMNNRLALPISSLASAAVAFGLGAMIFTNGNAPGEAAKPRSAPSTTAPVQAPDDVHERLTNVTVTETQTTHPKAPTAPQQTAKPKATKTPKPKATKTAGSIGPIKDAEGDGKVLDDLGHVLVPSVNLPIPDGVLPFPDKSPKPEIATPDGTDEYPYESNWGDDEEHAADPGNVCDPELAAALGVPVSPC